MPVSIVVGGQFGSEGKGKVAHCFAKKKKARIAIRVGGPNSGHTVYDDIGNRYIFKMLPTPSILEGVECILPSGSYIDVNILFNEIKVSGITTERLKVDPYAVIITDDLKELEVESGRRNMIGSTNSGTGAAVTSRVNRDAQVKFAKDEPKLKEFLVCTKSYLRKSLDAGEQVVVEGTQGYGLSVLHSHYYPYATSRDTTAAGFLSEAGLSPLDVQNVIMVIRAFPIRVAGNSGPLANEIDWGTVTSESGSPTDIIEYTSVTNYIRRVARFDPQVVRQAIAANSPNIIVLNHVDYFDYSVQDKLSAKVETLIDEVETSINRKINFIGLNPRGIIPR